jgi:benzodiazapine receptor
MNGQGVSVPAKSEQRNPARPDSVKPGIGIQIVAFFGFLALSYSVSYLGSLAIVMNAGGWYANASKAPWTPPGWVFAAVWSALYTAMAAAAWLVWRQRTARSRRALVAFRAQLALNLAWTPTFFGMYPMLGTAALWLALVLLVALLLGVAVTVLRFGPISRTAGVLMLPYISWIIYSASLNLYAATTN